MHNIKQVVTLLTIAFLWVKPAAGQGWESGPLPWTSVNSGPSVVSLAYHQLDVFFRGQSDQLLHIAWDGLNWTTWESLGNGNMQSDPSCVAFSSQEIRCYALSKEGSLLEGIGKPGGQSWGAGRWKSGSVLAGHWEWHPISNILLSKPVAVTTQGQIDVFGIIAVPADLQGHLTTSPASSFQTPGVMARMTFREGTWSQWERITPVEFDDAHSWMPWSCISWQPNEFECFSVAADRSLINRKFYGGVWTSSSIGGQLLSGPGCSTRAPGRLDCLARGISNNVYHTFKEQNGGWAHWERLAGQTISQPACVSWGPNRLDCFVEGSDHKAYQLFWNLGPEPWPPVGFPGFVPPPPQVAHQPQPPAAPVSPNHGSLSLHATVDAFGGDHSEIKHAGGPATITCTSATGGPPPIGAPDPGCRVAGVGIPGFAFLAPQQQRTTTGPGNVSLQCFGGRAPLNCNATVIW